MKETSPLRQVSGPNYPLTRDLGVVFEETDQLHSQHQSLGFQSSSSLSFLGPKPSFSLSYSTSNTTNTIPTSAISNASLLSTTNSPLNSSPNLTLPSVRRPRAGTMPSFLHPEMNGSNINHRPAQNAAFLLNTLETGRNRSGSLNLPPPSFDFWPLRQDTTPLTPSTEQLLQNEDDFATIARTMRSLGLEDDDENNAKNNNNNSTSEAPQHSSLFHQQTPPEFLLPSRSLLTGNNRNRSYSVNAAAKYDAAPQQQQQQPQIYASPLEGFNRKQQLRPRASSMGRADAVQYPAIPWTPSLPEQNNNYHEQPSLSLGDSELLANMLGNDESHTEKPYLQYSQSTPTSTRETPIQHASSRSLWVGNIDETITIDSLNQIFSTFGPIESIRLLPEKECGFVNFFQLEDAIRAKEEVLGNLGGRIGRCIVRVGFGKVDTAVTEASNSQPTRALWLGNIPGNTTPSTLQAVFSVFGHIESIRVLSHKNCAFINFGTIESAIKARNALLSNEINSQDFSGARVGFAKIPPPSPNSVDAEEVYTANNTTTDYENNLLAKATMVWKGELVKILTRMNMDEHIAKSFTKDLKISPLYFDSIPPVPEISNRIFDSARLKEMRKRIDSATDGDSESEIVAAECMEYIAEISSDYIGNTIVQRLFEKCSEETKTQMLKRIAPHLAALSVHKNGTWATQKIIDLAKTPEQIQLIHYHIKPFIPPLLLDQFGNYAVQCCLRLGVRTQYIFDAMVEKLMHIAQGRFGARSMRGILESEFISENQKQFIAAAICQNALSLSTNANGVLLLTWLIESTHFDRRMECITERLIPHLSQLCVHKFGSQVVYKLLKDPVSRDLVLPQLDLVEILTDQVRGLTFIVKVISSPDLTDEQQLELKTKACIELEKLNGPGHKKLLAQLLDKST